jgi:putative spermidine/putrescine transport system ATP-binding protein
MNMHATARKTAMPIADLSLAGLGKSYGSTMVVDGIDLDVAPGELVSLLGPSGCGKTTTLRMIAGLVAPTQGDILFRGRSVTDVPVHKRGVGVLFQNYALFPHMTVAGNVSFGLEMRSNDRTRSKSLVGDALEMVQLTHLAERYPHQLSGGQQQRVALARALVIEPAVLLLDEPFGALDKKLREEMQIQMKDIQKRLKITTIMVTHDQDEALTISDKIAVMNAGRIEQYGTPTEIYDGPTSRFVAGFIGSSNIFTGTVIERNGTNCIVKTSYGLQVTAKYSGLENEVLVCLRPEAIKVGHAADMTIDNGVDCALGTIARIVYRGASTEVHIALVSGEMLISSRPNGEIQNHIEKGAQVSLSWPVNACHALLS